MALCNYRLCSVGRRALETPEYRIVNMVCLKNKRKLRYNHVIDVLKFDYLLISQESDIISCCNNALSSLSNKF